MRHLIVSALLCSTATGVHAEMGSYELDPEHTTVYFTIDHIGYAKTLGVFTDVSGQFSYDASAQELGQVVVTIDAASVLTFNNARDGHVKNRDFLNVSQHPEITFVANSGTPTSDRTGTVTGELTILGQTQPVTLEVTLNKAAQYPFAHRKEVLGLSMTASIQRSAFGMSYGVGNGLVGDEVTINIETEAIKMD
ncbi:MAG: YceI family protein [Pseudomonadota bacterium]